MDLADRSIIKQTGCAENTPGKYACSWWHCRNNCEGAKISQGITKWYSARVEDNQLKNKVANSANQCSDWGDNALGRAIADDPEYHGVSCEMACAVELGGYESDDPDLKEGKDSPRPYGELHPEGSADGCTQTYKTYDLIGTGKNSSVVKKPN